MKRSLPSFVVALMMLAPSAGSQQWPRALEARAAGAERAFSAPVAVTRFKARPPWQDVFGKILVFGQSRDADGMIPAMKWLEDVRGAKTQSHVADYAVLWGGKDGRGVFVPGYASLVSEDWRLDAQDHFQITQWIIQLDLDGKRVGLYTGTLVETRDGQVLGSGGFQPTPAEIEAKLAALLAQWRAYAPKP